MEKLLGLPEDEKRELISVIQDSIARKHDTGVSASSLTEAERLATLNRLWGAWKDSTPDDLAAQIISSRSISDREINLDD